MHVQSYPSHKIKFRLSFQALHNREVPPSYDGLFYGVWVSGPMSQQHQPCAHLGSGLVKLASIEGDRVTTTN